MNSLAVLLLTVMPGASPDDINTTVTSLRSQEAKMKTAYQELAAGYRKVNPTITKIKECNHDITILNTQILNIVGTSFEADQARYNLRERVRDLEQKKDKLEAEVKGKTDVLKETENEFKGEYTKAIERANEALLPVLKDLKIADDRKAFDAVVSVLDLFIFDDRKDVPFVGVGSVLDQELLAAVGKCLGTSGTKQLARLKKLFDRSTAMKYAAVMAAYEMGPDAAADKDIPSALNELKTSLLKNKTLPKDERDNRQRLVQKALDALKP